MQQDRLLRSGKGADQVLGSLDENVFEVGGGFMKGTRRIWDYFQHDDLFQKGQTTIPSLAGKWAAATYGPARPVEENPAGPKTSRTQPP
jgi:hypothetical protein